MKLGDNMKNKKAYIRRMNVIAGQITGIKNMIEEERTCNDIMVQIAALDRSLKSLGNEIFKDYLSTTLVEEIKKDNLEVLDGVIDLCNMIK